LLLERKILESEGYEVTTASSGQEALAAISAKKFNLVLLDIMMPETDGLEVSRQIQQHLGRERLPVIFVTAKDDSATMREGFRAGGTVFLAKPFTSRQLLSVVRALIGK